MTTTNDEATKREARACHRCQREFAGAHHIRDCWADVWPERGEDLLHRDVTREDLVRMGCIRPAAQDSERWREAS